MFRSEEMRKVTVFSLNKDRDAILTRLHSLGLIQPVTLKTKDFPDLKRPENIQEIGEISDKLIRVSRINSILKLAPMKLSMPQTIFGLETLEVKKIKRSTTKELMDNVAQFIKKHETSAINLELKYKELTEWHDELEALKTVILIFDKIGKPLHMFRDSENISIITGRIPSTNIHKLSHDIKKETEDYTEIIAKKETKKDSIVTIIALKEYAGKSTFIAKKHGVNIFTFPELPKVENLKSWVNEELKKNKAKTDEILKKISTLQKRLFSQSLILREEVSLLKERHDVLHTMLDSDNFFITQGWVMKKKVENLKHELDKLTKGNVTYKVDEPTKEELEQVPVKLTNPKWLKSFEMLTELYSLPKYRDLDPTFIIGPLFIVYAAFMLTDAVYGLILFVAGLVMFKKFSKYDINFKYVCINIIAMGAMTMFFGVLTGGYFGDLPKYLFGIEGTELALWRDPLSDPLYFLIVAIGVGVVHLNIGLILGTIEDYRKKQWKTLVGERLVWFLIQISVLLLVFKIPFGKYLAALTVLIIIILNGPLGIMGVTG